MNRECEGCNWRLGAHCFRARAPAVTVATCPDGRWGDGPRPLDGPPSPELAAARLAVCLACDQYDPETQKCRSCGCADTMPRRAASQFGGCPRGLWPV